MTGIEHPRLLRANAWNGAPVVGQLEPGSVWGQRPVDFITTPKLLAPPPAIDLRDWRSEAVGWGLVLPDNAAIEPAARASVADSDGPKLLADVVEKRGGVVVRHDPALGNGYVMRYYPDGSSQQMSVIGSLPGTARGALPMYLMIYGAPTIIPWSFQYQLNSDRFVGRLDPRGQGVENYLAALKADWTDSRADSGAPLLWTVDHGGGDITQLMASVLGDALWSRFLTDAEMLRRLRLGGGDATGAQLIAAFAELRPAFVTTTSHGLTSTPAAGSLSDSIGIPVDATFAAIDLDALFAAWSPGGMIWYAHACCSAGSDAPSRFVDLFASGDAMRTMLDGVATHSGACTSPLAQRLLGANAPARAFVGHVEPTFDWTLRDPATGQPLANTLIDALYNQLFSRGPGGQPTPIGYALAKLFDEADAFFTAWVAAIAEVNRGTPSASDWALYRKLAGYDRQGTVILGDPAVSIPLAGTAP